MIYELASPLEINSLVKMAEGVAKASPEDLRNRLVEAVTKKDAKVFIDKDKGSDKIRGFLYCSVEEFDGKDIVYVQLCIVEAVENNRKLTLELLNRAESFARDKNIEKLAFMTIRNPKAFARKYKFELASYFMTKSVKEKTHE